MDLSSFGENSVYLVFRDAEENYELDEDDYELLQEANVTGFRRVRINHFFFAHFSVILKHDLRFLDNDFISSNANIFVCSRATRPSSRG